jgi:hypothetical protein
MEDVAKAAAAAAGKVVEVSGQRIKRLKTHKHTRYLLWNTFLPCLVSSPLFIISFNVPSHIDFFFLSRILSLNQSTPLSLSLIYSAPL